MTELIRRDEARQSMLWKGLQLQDFADSLGVSLDELRNEYDEMIRNFELQKSYLKNFVPKEKAIVENEVIRAPSPTPSGESQNSIKKDKKKRPLSTAGIQSSFRTARNTLRRKISGANSSSANAKSLSRKHEHNSVSSLSKPDSDSGSFEHESSRIN